MENVKFIDKPRVKGGNVVAVNVERCGRPFGQIWTFKAKNEIHFWHFKTVNGLYQVFPTRRAAQDFAAHLCQ